MISYATQDDYVTILDTDPPANIASLLRSASLLVRRTTLGDLYDADADGKPTDATKLQALTEATVVQAAAWSAAGIDPAAAGLLAKGGVSSKSLDGASVTYDTSTTALAARQAMVNDLCPDALQILHDAHLATTRVWTFG